jgi:DNA mismatch endonuclease (patch repair protein)
MTDVFSEAERSLVMSRIRGRGNKATELTLAKLLRAAGLTGWRRHAAMIGRPDFLFRKERLVIFVDGCFWHGSNVPANNQEFWLKKLTGNKGRDRLVTRTLRQGGWRVLRIWEHELKSDATRVVFRIRRALDAADR